MAMLPRAFLDTPIAHRGLHGPGRPENSLAAAEAAIEQGYGIELDIQPVAGGAGKVAASLHGCASPIRTDPPCPSASPLCLCSAFFGSFKGQHTFFILY